MGEYAKSLIAKLRVTPEEQADDVIQRTISGMDAAERRQSLDILNYRRQMEIRLEQLRKKCST